MPRSLGATSTRKMRFLLVAVFVLESAHAFLSRPSFIGPQKSTMILLQNSADEHAGPAPAGGTTAYLHPSSVASPKLLDATSVPSTAESLFHTTTTTLAGPFLLRCWDDGTTCSFQCFAIEEWKDSLDPAFQQSDGAQSWAALHHCNATASSDQSFSQGQACALEMRATMNDGHVQVVVTHLPSSNEQAEILPVLSRILAQWIVRRRKPPPRSLLKSITITLPQNPDPLQLDWSRMDASNNDDAVHHLFADLVSPGSSEIVEMVDRNGHTLGCIPRTLVHKHNLLHRGIGMFVTAPSPIQTMDSVNQPDLYVHRRTTNKRIFPSLYDMFVGGVSLAGEDASTTALREVAEELGLDGNQDQLSPPLLTCVVCTAYNRCVVVLFGYTMDLSKETVSWQEEEVAWGSFVPYPVVEAAADKSIQRLVDSQTWPSQLPAVQSPRHGHAHMETEHSGDWELWDFVPDGLLVWEAWLRKLATTTTTSQ